VVTGPSRRLGVSLKPGNPLHLLNHLRPKSVPPSKTEPFLSFFYLSVFTMCASLLFRLA
jgi:hypothetical protein